MRLQSREIIKQTKIIKNKKGPLIKEVLFVSVIDINKNLCLQIFDTFLGHKLLVIKS